MSARRDAARALLVFSLLGDNPDTFAAVATPESARGQVPSILKRYSDHAFSYVDAVIFHIVDIDPSINQVVTVDGGDFRSFAFAHRVTVVTP